MKGSIVRSVCAIWVVATIFFLPAAHGAPISFTFEADVAGTLDAQPFNSRISFNINSDSLLADTFSNESTNGYRMFVPLAFFDSTVTIDGIGTGSLLTPHFLIANPNPYCECVTVMTTSGIEFFGVWQTGLSLSNPYDFTTSLAPVAGGHLRLSGQSLPLETSIGTLVLDGFSFTDANATFSATLVPIPAAAWLFGSCLAVLGWVRSRKTI